MRSRRIQNASRLLAAATAALLLAAGCSTPGSGQPLDARPSPSSTSGAGQPVAPSAEPTVKTEPMADLLVEIHVPLTPAPGLGPSDYAFPWIDDIEAYLGELDGSEGEVYDDGEELGDEYLFFVMGAPEADLIQVARRVSRLDGVPKGVYAVVNDTEGDMGEGRRVDLQ